jgi:hypothetical protein
MTTVATVAGVVGLLAGLVDGVAVADAVGELVADADGLEVEAEGLGLVGAGLEVLDVPAPLHPVRARTRTAVATLPRARAARGVRDARMTASDFRSGPRSGGLSGPRPVPQIYAGSADVSPQPVR